jgi:hypothetical protein
MIRLLLSILLFGGIHTTSWASEEITKAEPVLKQTLTPQRLIFDPTSKELNVFFLEKAAPHTPQNEHRLCLQEAIKKKTQVEIEFKAYSLELVSCKSL